MEVLISLEELLGTIEDILTYKGFGYKYLELFDLKAVHNFL